MIWQAVFIAVAMTVLVQWHPMAPALLLLLLLYQGWWWRGAGVPAKASSRRVQQLLLLLLYGRVAVRAWAAALSCSLLPELLLLVLIVLGHCCVVGPPGAPMA